MKEMTDGEVFGSKKELSDEDVFSSKYTSNGKAVAQSILDGGKYNIRHYTEMTDLDKQKPDATFGGSLKRGIISVSGLMPDTPDAVLAKELVALQNGSHYSKDEENAHILKEYQKIPSSQYLSRISDQYENNLGIEAPLAAAEATFTHPVDAAMYMTEQLPASLLGGGIGGLTAKQLALTAAQKLAMNKAKTSLASNILTGSGFNAGATYAGGYAPNTAGIYSETGDIREAEKQGLKQTMAETGVAALMGSPLNIGKNNLKNIAMKALLLSPTDEVLQTLAGNKAIGKDTSGGEIAASAFGGMMTAPSDIAGSYIFKEKNQNKETETPKQGVDYDKIIESILQAKQVVTGSEENGFQPQQEAKPEPGNQKEAAHMARPSEAANAPIPEQAAQQVAQPETSSRNTGADELEKLDQTKNEKYKPSTPDQEVMPVEELAKSNRINVKQGASIDEQAVVDGADNTSSYLEQLINLRGVAAEIGMPRQMDNLIKKVKDDLKAGKIDSATFTKAAKLFKGKDAKIYGVLQKIAQSNTQQQPFQAKPKRVRASGNLLQRIKQLGGIDDAQALDITGERRAPGAWRFAFKKGGTSLDDLATQLADEGFSIDTKDVDGGVQQLRDMIRAHINGERNFKHADIEAQAEKQALSAAYDSMAKRAEELGIKWQNLTESQLDDAVYQAEDDLRVASLAKEEALSDAGEEALDAIANDETITNDDFDNIPFGDEIKVDQAAMDAYFGVNHEEANNGQADGASRITATQSVARSQETRGEPQAGEGETGLPKSYTEEQIKERERRAEHTRILAEAEQRNLEREDQRKREELTQRRNVNTVASDNFELGQSKEEVKRMAQTGIADMFGQKAENLPSTQAISSVKAAVDISKSDKLKLIAEINKGNITPEDVQDVVGNDSILKAQGDNQSANKDKEKIGDFGEKIVGARKDITAVMHKEYSNDEIASLPLSKIWPADFHEKIEDPYISAFAFAAREEIPSKPRKPYLVAKWVANIKMLRSLTEAITSSDTTRAKTEAKLNESKELKGFATKVRLLESINRSQWKRIGKVGEYPNAYRYGDEAKGEGYKVQSPFVSVQIDGTTQTFTGASTIADVIEKVNEKLGVTPKESKMQFTARGHDGAYFIHKTGDREYRKLKTFNTSREALDYKRDHYDDLVAAWDAVKERDNVKEADVRRTENRPRTAQDWRKGNDITTEQFSEAFGFRGGQFGNWVSQGKNIKERQGMLNNAYDALMDLSDILGIPPKAISLNGELGMSFGARGSGSASAHYESDNLVINLTKTRGAGTLAHEWFHALDNYFQRNRNAPIDHRRETRYVTYLPEARYVHKGRSGMPSMTLAELNRQHERDKSNPRYDPQYWEKDPKHPEGVRPEVEEKFAALVEALNESPMTKRASLIDAGKEDGYWSRIIERAARSFENYIIAKMAEKGYNNDYLANVVNIADFKRDEGRYPYLKDEELAPVVKAFDDLFGEMQTKETDKGTAIYSTNESATAARNPFTLSSLKTAIDSAFPGVNKFSDALLGTGKFHIIGSDEIEAYLSGVLNPDIRYSKDGRILAFVRAGETFLVHDNISATNDNVKGLLLHEIGLHALKLGRTDTEFQKILHHFEAMGEAGNQKVKDAQARVPKNTPAHLITEESLGYFLEKNPDLTFSQRVIAAIRTLIRKIGAELPSLQRMAWFKWADSLTTDDIVYMATQATKNAPESLKTANDMGVFKTEPAYSESYEVQPDTARNLPIDEATLIELRRAAAGIESAEKGITFTVNADGKAIVTGPARVKIPARFQQFANTHGLTLVVHRASGIFSNASAPMPINYRESGALYYGEIGTDHIDRTKETRFSRATQDDYREAAAMPRDFDILSKVLPKHIPLVYDRDELGNIRSDLLGTRRLKDFLHASFIRPMAVRTGMAQPSKELSKLMRNQKAFIDKAMRAVSGVIDLTKDMTEAESALISRIVTNELLPGDVPTDHAMKIAAIVERTMTELGQEAVELQMLSKEAFERWKGQYLPRFYMRHLDPEIKGIWQRTFKASPIAGFRSGSLKGRGRPIKSIMVKDFPQWEALGWELRDKAWEKNSTGQLELTVKGKALPNTDTVGIWKDYTQDERLDMGEIQDFKLRFVMGFLSMQRDISIGRLYKQIASNPEWTRRTASDGYSYVPVTEIPDTGGLNRYGMLAGMYVKNEILQHISQHESDDNEFQKYYKAGLAKWKEGKTVLNPVTHMNNFVSNISMAHFAGVSYWDNEKYFFALKELIQKAPMMREAEDVGLFTGDFSHAEIMKSMPEEIRNLVGSVDSTAIKTGRFIWKLASLGLNEKMANAYHWGDSFFKYAIYRDARIKGLSPEDAVYYASKYIFNYDDLPVTARAIRDYGLPFFAYTYKVIPVLASTAIEYPWRFAAPAVTISSTNALTYAALAGSSGGDDWWLQAIMSGTMTSLLNAYSMGFYGEDEPITAGQKLEQNERKNLADWDKGASAMGTQKTIRLGADEKTGMPVFINVYRFIPGGDIQDTQNEKGGIGIPAPFMPSNPVLNAFSALVDNKNWNGKEMFDVSDTNSEKAVKTADFMYKLLLPTIVPGGAHYDRIMNATANFFDTTIEKAHPLKDYTGTGKDELPVQPKYAAMQTIGIKARPVDLELSGKMNAIGDNAKVRSIDQAINRAGRLLGKGAISQREFDSIREKGIAKMRAHGGGKEE